MKFLSLGAYCQVAYQIERYSGLDTSSPFDWLVTPMGSLLDVLRDWGELLFHEVNCFDNGSEISCANYRLSYPHELRRDDQYKIIFNADDMENSRRKLIHKMDRFKEEAGTQAVTFIRFGTQLRGLNAWPYLEDDQIYTSKLNELVNVLENYSTDFRVAVVNQDKIWPIIHDVKLDDRVDIHQIATPEKQTWQGDDEEWNTILSQYS